MPRKQHHILQKSLIHSIEHAVKFSEADPLGIVWHGNYIRYFEDGREAFGAEYNLRYLDFFGHGVVVPVVNVQCDYKRSLKYGDRVRIETEFLPCEAAKIKFRYRLVNIETGQVAATGTSVQVFLDKQDSTLLLTNPPFF